MSSESGSAPPRVRPREQESGGGPFSRINRRVAGANDDQAVTVGKYPFCLCSLAVPVRTCEYMQRSTEEFAQRATVRRGRIRDEGHAEPRHGRHDAGDFEPRIGDESGTSA